MPESKERLFPCTVFPDTSLRAQRKAHVLAIASSSIVLLFGYAGLPAAAWGFLAVATICSAWIFRPSAKRHLLQFVGTLEFHLGNDVPSEVEQSSLSCWLAPLVTLFSGLPFLPITRIAIIYGLLCGALVLARRKTGVTIGTFVATMCRATFAFLAYPDFRYYAPAGTAAVWIPAETIWHRRCRFAIFLLPFYLALCCEFVITAYVIGRPWQQAAADLVLFAPVPWLAVLVLFAEPLQQLQNSLKPAFSAGQTEWEQCVSRVRQSTHVADGVRLADHFFIGWVLPSREEAWHPLRQVHALDLPCRTPALVHESSGAGHVHLEGPTGVNKTTVGQAGYIIQSIRGRNVPAVDALGKPLIGIDGEPLWRTSDPVPTLVIDLKGDPALFNTTREECEKRGQVFRFFTPEAGKATSFFNPITNLHHSKRPIIEFCEIILNALDLWHGTFFYGGGYFSEQCRNLYLKTLLSAPSLPTTWEAQYELLIQTLDRRQHKDVFELLGRIFALAQYPILGPPPDGVDSIHMPTLFERNECAYFWLPAMDSAMSIITIAKFVLFAYLSAARQWNTSGKPLKYGLCFIDEMQVVCGQNTERIFQQASGAKVRLFVSNQSLSNLDTRDAPNLSKTIWTNTHIKQAFGLVDTREREDWIKLSGETVGILQTDSFGTDGEGRRTRSTSRQEVIHSRLNQNVINAVNNTAGSSLVYILRDNGFCRFNGIPRQIWCPYPMTLEEYERRVTTPWPELPETKIELGQIQTTVVNAQPPQAVERQAHEKYAALEDLFQQASKHSGRRVLAADA
jgi:hypothetical protein